MNYQLLFRLDHCRIVPVGNNYLYYNSPVVHIRLCRFDSLRFVTDRLVEKIPNLSKR